MTTPSEFAAKEKTPFQSSLASIVMDTIEGDPKISGLALESWREKVSFVSGTLSETVTRSMSISRSPGKKFKTPLGPEKSPVSAERKTIDNCVETRKARRQASKDIYYLSQETYQEVSGTGSARMLSFHHLFELQFAEAVLPVNA